MTDALPVEPDGPDTPLTDHPSIAMTNVSGGVDLDAERDVNIGGDVVGRDKITQIVEGDQIAGDQEVIEVEPGGVVVAKGGRLTNVHIPRAVQIAIGVAVLAIVVSRDQSAHACQRESQHGICLRCFKRDGAVGTLVDRADGLWRSSNLRDAPRAAGLAHGRRRLHRAR